MNNKERKIRKKNQGKKFIKLENSCNLPVCCVCEGGQLAGVDDDVPDEISNGRLWFTQDKSSDFCNDETG